MTAPTASQVAEVRRLRAELAALAVYVTLLQRRILAAIDDSRVAAERAYLLGHAAGAEAGRLAVLEEIKATDHAIHDLAKNSAPVWAMHSAALRRSA